MISVLTQSTNVQINDEFWAKVKTLISTYNPSYNTIIIPEKPIYEDLENTWVYEIMEQVINHMDQNELIVFDGRMHGQIIYNLALGFMMFANMELGRLTIIGDGWANNIFSEHIRDLQQVDVACIVSSTPVDPDPSRTYILVDEAAAFFRTHWVRKVVIDNTIPASNSDVQIVLSTQYYRRNEIEYSPENSNAFVDFIVNSCSA
jgi:hypothetical protein